MSAGGIISRKGPIVDFPGLGQNIFAGAAKSGKMTFSPLETKKTTFFCKNWWENVKLQNLGAALTSTSEAHAPEISYDKKAEEDNKNIFTNKHPVIFENNLQLFLFLIITDTEHFVSALVVRPQEYRYLFANL